VPAIVQDYLDATVLMMAWMNQGRCKKLNTGKHGFGVVPGPSCGMEKPGHIQKVILNADCDNDALLIGVEQLGDCLPHR